MAPLPAPNDPRNPLLHVNSDLIAPAKRISPTRSALMPLLLIFLAWLGPSPIFAFDEPTWTERLPATSPPPRFDHALAYDAMRERVVLFGGRWAAPFGDTWEWDGQTWTEQTPQFAPSARFGHTMVYDNARHRVVLFGGTIDKIGLDDTWEWDGTTWTHRTPITSPPPRWNHAMAYDSARQHVVLFGGLFGSDLPLQGTLLSDTWAWDGDAWTQLAPTVVPTARHGHAMVYDSDRSQVVLQGGYFDAVSQDDTWEWDGVEWWLQDPNWLPMPRQNHRFAFDPHRRRLVLFGGCLVSSLAFEILHDDTWEWDGTHWELRSPTVSPSRRCDQGMAYDGAREEVVLFGGRGLDASTGSETWIYARVERSCDGVDDNGNGLVDEGCDDDGDGYCDAAMSVAGAPQICPSGGGDCDDGEFTVNPGAADLPGDSLDQDCDGTAVCNPAAMWPNHGQFVSCVAQACNALVSDGALSRSECTDLVREAARGTTGR